jgi:erythrocyte band 7 integral membrane protein
MSNLGLLQEWGRFSRVLEPGLHLINPVSQSIVEVNQQTQILEYSQMCISKDGVRFDATVVVFYRVFDSLKVAYRLGMNEQECLLEIATGTLRNIAGEQPLQQVIENRDLVCNSLRQMLNRAMDTWGIYVEMASIKDISIDPDVVRIMESVPRTRKAMEAMLISYQAEVSCAKLFEELMSKKVTKATIQVRYLNALDRILSSDTNDKVIYLKTSIPDNKWGEETLSALI